MIDEKINQTLSELEKNLRDVEAAKEQVNRTVSSFNELSHTSQDYVRQLDRLTTEIPKLVDSIRADYSRRVEELEKDRKAIIQSSKDASKELSDATSNFKHSLSKISSLLIFNIALTGVTLILFICIIVFRVTSL